MSLDGFISSANVRPEAGLGVVTVLAPFFIMQPSFGLGFPASKLSNPTPARLRSLMNHIAFGVGLYLFGLLVNCERYMPNPAWTGWRGFGAVFKHFSGLEFSLLPNIVHAHPAASNASRWAAKKITI